MHTPTLRIEHLGQAGFFRTPSHYLPSPMAVDAKD
jgi:hypothetical protein